jgi:LPXTG-motif cell wall-anchored protein
MRRLLAAVVFGLVLLVAVPTVQAKDYPPEQAGGGVFRRPPAPAVPPAAISQQRPESDLAQTGSDASRNLGVGVSLVVLGSAILVVTRRRRGAVPD